MSEIKDYKVTDVFSYCEKNNPYSNEQSISVAHLAKNDNEWFEFFISNADNDGCGIFLTPQQIKELICKLTEHIK